MATITTDTFLDGGVARTAGESWNINGATLTVRTDTRWHANAPAGMTGTFGVQVALSTSVGGRFAIDATKVRWLPYNSGTGTVPAIGTIVTQGTASGYLLAVYPDISSAPLAVGSAMPSSGFLKFREVTGAFSAGFLSGISANAPGPDTTGWIEVVFDSGIAISANQLGSVETYGDWFYLTNTNGVRGQIISTPTNGGGSLTPVCSFQVETAPGSNVFEWWGVTNTTLGWSAGNIATDQRAKIAEYVGNGQVRIGSNGTIDLGYLPPSGCRVRMPNILIQSAATASRAANQSGTAAQAVGLSIVATYKQVLLQYVHGPIVVNSISNVNKFEMRNCATAYSCTLANMTLPVIIDNCILNSGINGNNAAALTLTNCNNSIITNTKSVTANSSGSMSTFRIESSDSVTLTNITSVLMKARTAVFNGLQFNNCSNCKATNFSAIGGGSVYVQNSRNSVIKNTDWVDNTSGPTLTTAPAHVWIAQAGSSDTTFDGLTFGFNGELQNSNTYGYILSTNNTVGRTKARNVGTRRNPLSSGTTNIVAGIWLTAGESNVSLQRIYITDFRDAKLNTANTSTLRTMRNNLIEDVYGKLTALTFGEFTNSTWRKIGGTVATTAQAGTTGVHWADFFTSDTAGHIAWIGNGPSPESAGSNFITASSAPGTGYVSSSVSLDTAGDEFFSEMPYFVKGHTGFQNVAPVRTETSNATMTLYYQINNGSGWSDWKTLVAANLSTEYVNPAGMKLRLRGIQGTNPNTANALTNVKIFTTSTLDAQADNLYPLDVVTLTLEGLKPGSEVRAYVGTNPATAVEIGGTESSAETFSFTHTASGQEGYIHIFAMGYQPIIIPRTFAFEDSSLLIQQVIDRNYYNPS